MNTHSSYYDDFEHTLANAESCVDAFVASERLDTQATAVEYVKDFCSADQHQANEIKNDGADIGNSRLLPCQPCDSREASSPNVRQMN